MGCNSQIIMKIFYDIQDGYHKQLYFELNIWTKLSELFAKKYYDVHQYITFESIKIEISSKILMRDKKHMY